MNEKKRKTEKLFAGKQRVEYCHFSCENNQKRFRGVG